MNAMERGFLAVFRRYLAALLRRSFRGVWIARDAHFPESGFVAVSNHSSWWDGFIPYAVQYRLRPQTPFALMMDAAQLRRFPFFRLGGAFAVDSAHPRSAYRSVERAASLARDGAGVWIFPQGAMAPIGPPLRFKRGYLHVARRAAVPIVPVAMRFEMLEAQRPDAFLEIAAPIDPSESAAEERIPQRIAAMLDRFENERRAGTLMERRISLFERAPGIDDVLARFAGRQRT